MMLSSRTKLIVVVGVVLLAIIGWAMYASIQSGYERQEARFAEERAQLTGQIEELGSEREALSAQVAELEQTLEEERTAVGDLATLRGQIDETTGSLNQRLETLGARERELADLDAALNRAREQVAALEEEQATARQRLTARLTTLGERERDLAEAERSLSQTKARQEALTTTAEALTRNVTEKRAALGALDLQLGTLERDRSQRAHELATVQAELGATRTALDQLQAQLDKALLAQSVAELETREAALQDELTNLDAELAHKQPLFERSVDLSREIATLDERLRSLIAQRADLAGEFTDVVDRIEQPAAGAGNNAQAEPGSAAGAQSGGEAEAGSNDGVARVAGD
jgi:chromosome segregation ATPase